MNLESVTLPQGTAVIGSGVFRGCPKLADANGFVIVGGVLFDYLGTAANVVIPEGVTEIDSQVFSGNETTALR